MRNFLRSIFATALLPALLTSGAVPTEHRRTEGERRQF